MCQRSSYFGKESVEESEDRREELDVVPVVLERLACHEE